MHILILGGGGFLGKRLAKELLENEVFTSSEPIDITLVDIGFPPDMLQDARLECIQADLSDEAAMKDILQRPPEVIFHLAAIVSGEAEKNLDLGMKINFHASLQLLELCRKLAIHPRIVFASSCAVFGGDVSKVITDETGPKPRSSYGTQKAMVELLMNDYSRRGIVDARSLRLPTIAVRPGKPNAATSSFISSIIREPLHGKKASYPVPVETAFWIQSPKRIMQNFIHAANLDAALLGADRVINLPGLTVTVKEMIDMLAQITSSEVTKLISYEPDAFLQSIVLTWPAHFTTKRATTLGFVSDASVKEIIQAYIEEEGITYI
ncbi:SDR family oxidoreductase [Rhodocytophaga rosea]|uniref:SDR family oxidoreductase n=1 Tax=Rhodocytophaga rosea TaxID=2704465 RepID=A0A6C0GH59_9BACT|nr:D-erythronate dehydrogenase [Rhodocytophaga rosea]QHT67297.1 SDR family oxidoreductase [Rhodocytophaga rosea]